MENPETMGTGVPSGENDPELASIVRALVGACCIDSVQAAVKRAMVEEALRRTRANFAQTAQLLGVRRQAVQQMVERLGLRDFVGVLRKNATESLGDARALTPVEVTSE